MGVAAGLRHLELGRGFLPFYVLTVSVVDVGRWSHLRQLQRGRLLDKAAAAFRQRIPQSALLNRLLTRFHQIVAANARRLPQIKVLRHAFMADFVHFLPLVVERVVLRGVGSLLHLIRHAGDVVVFVVCTGRDARRSDLRKVVTGPEADRLLFVPAWHLFALFTVLAGQRCIQDCAMARDLETSILADGELGITVEAERVRLRRVLVATR